MNAQVSPVYFPGGLLLMGGYLYLALMLSTCFYFWELLILFLSTTCYEMRLVNRVSLKVPLSKYHARLLTLLPPLRGKCYFLNCSNLPTQPGIWSLSLKTVAMMAHRSAGMRSGVSCCDANWMRPIFTSTVLNAMMWIISWRRFRL